MDSVRQDPFDSQPTLRKPPPVTFGSARSQHKVGSVMPAVSEPPPRVTKDCTHRPRWTPHAQGFPALGSLTPAEENGVIVRFWMVSIEWWSEFDNGIDLAFGAGWGPYGSSWAQ